MGYRVEWKGLTELPVRLASRLVPREYSLIAEDTVGTPTLRMDFEVRGGVPQCRGLHYIAATDGREIRTSDLRYVKVEDLLEFATGRVGEPFRIDENGTLIATSPANRDDVTGTIRELRQARQGRRRKVNDAMLRRVAEIYRSNIDDNPTKAVADTFDKDRRTARRYVNLARDRGFLGEAIPGRAGETVIQERLEHASIAGTDHTAKLHSLIDQLLPAGDPSEDELAAKAARER